MDFVFVPVDYQSFDYMDENYVKIYGRNNDGKRVCVIDKVNPYFWAIIKDKTSDKELKKLVASVEKIKVSNTNRTSRVLKTEVHDKKFLGRDVKSLKIFITNYKDAPAFADQLDFDVIDKRREHDLGTITRYIMDRQVVPFNRYKVSGTLCDSSDFGGMVSTLNVDYVIKAENFTLVNKEKGDDFVPSILACDIETDDLEIGKGKILMISVHGRGHDGKLVSKVFSFGANSSSSSLDFVVDCKSEAGMLQSFVDFIKENTPDVLVGYYSDSFDMPYIRERCKKLKVDLSLGLDGSSPWSIGTKRQSVRFEGLVHLDLFKFIQINYSQYLQSETLSLNEVAGELLGENKLVHEFKHSSKLTSAEWEQFFRYNLQDSVITFRLCDKIWHDMAEFSRVTCKPLFEMSRDGMSTHVEDYILNNLYRFNEVAEKKAVHDEIGERMGREKYEGAFVLEPTPGLYDQVAVFDFTSFWPSIISTFNLSRSTLLEKKSKDSITVEVSTSPKRVHYFSKKPGFFPEMLKEIITLRKACKAELKVNPSPIVLARSNSFKLLANAAYGYQGFFGARYYCPEASASATAISRKFIKETITKAEDFGFKAIYGDTDSLMLEANGKTRSDALTFLKKINGDLPGIMELDLEDFYKRGLWVTTRGGESGAKKKYALINDKGKMKIRGFETVRRDWCRLARNLQNEILKMILTEGNEKSALLYAKEIISKLKSRRIDVKDILIRTQLKKSIDVYKSRGPHVLAAEMMISRSLPVDSGMLIEYFISEPEKDLKGKPKSKRIGDRVALPGDDKPYDIDYYLNNQILPAVENIFQVFSIETKDIIEGESQKRLF
ncbi:MAG: DNA-directed DNA polymerase [Nanoarchaeota archaeon]